MSRATRLETSTLGPRGSSLKSRLCSADWPKDVFFTRFFGHVFFFIGFYEYTRRAKTSCRVRTTRVSLLPAVTLEL